MFIDKSFGKMISNNQGGVKDTWNVPPLTADSSTAFHSVHYHITAMIARHREKHYKYLWINPMIRLFDYCCFKSDINHKTYCFRFSKALDMHAQVFALICSSKISNFINAFIYVVASIMIDCLRSDTASSICAECIILMIYQYCAESD